MVECWPADCFDTLPSVWVDEVQGYWGWVRLHYTQLDSWQRSGALIRWRRTAATLETRARVDGTGPSVGLSPQLGPPVRDRQHTELQRLVHSSYVEVSAVALNFQRFYHFTPRWHRTSPSRFSFSPRSPVGYWPLVICYTAAGYLYTHNMHAA